MVAIAKTGPSLMLHVTVQHLIYNINIFLKGLIFKSAICSRNMSTVCHEALFHDTKQDSVIIFHITWVSHLHHHG